MIKIEINANTDANGDIIFTEEMKKIIPKNSIVKIIVYPLVEKSDENLESN